MSTDADVAYQSTLGDKVYMMGVSPYFYTGKLYTLQKEHDLVGTNLSRLIRSPCIREELVFQQ